MPTIHTRHERRRGCGFRKPGGLYLVADGPGSHCGKLPLPLICCPTCGHGIKPASGWGWVNAAAILGGAECSERACSCRACPLAERFLSKIGRAGLLWVGEEYYPTPSHFSAEASEMGLSRRIGRIPRGFEVGSTWVLLAHRRGIRAPDRSWSPAVFRVFRPNRIEYVVRDTDDDAALESLERRGVVLVRIERQPDPPLFEC